MRTDKHLYAIFQHEPRWLFLLAGLPDPGDCRFRSEQFKSIQRTCDGLIEPLDVTQPLTVVEFQLHGGDDPYLRIVEEMVGAQRSSEGRRVKGLIFFGREVRNPATEPWNLVVTAYVFEDLLRAFAEARPEHPLSHLMHPVVEENDLRLEQDGADHYRSLIELKDQGAIPPDLCEVYIELFWQRFRGKTRKEIKMILLKDLPDLEDTVAGKEILELGEARGEAKGEAKGFRAACIMLAREKFGELPQDLVNRVNALHDGLYQELLVEILHLDSLEALADWLDQATSQEP